MVVLPDPLGPRRPMTSPAPTVKETPSTARRGPYHLVIWFATMTCVMTETPEAASPGGSTARARASLGIAGAGYSRKSGACFMAFHASGSCAVKKLAFSRACISRMKS